MNKKELIEKYEYLNHDCFRRVDTSQVLRDLKQLDEPEKVKVPQFVADWIEVAKTVYSLTGGMMYGGPGVNKWLENEDNQRTFTLAWFDGYEIEKEKRYMIKLKGVPDGAKFLKYTKVTREWYFGMRRHYNDIEVSHTRKQLEDGGFGEVFNSPLFEVEEVEE
jgi:hypothetical protein|nr:MAG TPA: Protein of unknown function (DUF1642) [Caudoviricetes sp.]